jgi:RecA/RadA recombinase
MVTLFGKSMPVRRINTGLYSFDHAFINREGAIGLPIGKGIELYGATFCGKSTITYGLAGIIGRIIERDIALADFEGFDPKFLQTVLETVGFRGSINCIQEEEDEEALDKLLSALREKEYGVGILDSIGAISPVSEAEGDLGESNMGRRAFLLAQFTRKALKIMRSDEPKTIIMINHAYPRIGGRGLDTPGGEVKKYLSSIRIAVKRKYVKGKYEEYPDGSYIIEGTVVKNRWGLKDRTFNLFVLSGEGIHLGLTALYDAMNLGIVKKIGRTYKIGEQSFGSIKEIIMQAHAGNDEFFNPFIQCLADQKLYEESVVDETPQEMDDEELDS